MRDRPQGRRSFRRAPLGGQPLARVSNGKVVKRTSEPKALRVLVVGAGVGGISIARGLLRDGHDVTVFEQRPDMRPGGGSVTIWSNGSTVLQQLGVDMKGAGQLLSALQI